MKHLIAPTVIAALCGTPALALEITTIFEGTVDGAIDDVAFTDQSFVLTVTGDTDSLLPFDFGPDTVGFDLPVDTAVISLPGLNGGTTLTFTGTNYVTVNNGAGNIGFTNENFNSGLIVTDPVFDTYDLAGPLAPTTGSGDSNSFPEFDTDGGLLVFASGTPALIFTATVIPEPTSLALLSLGGLMMVRRRHRKAC